MGMTLAETILAAHTEANEVRAGQFINVNVDVVLANDITAPIAIHEFERIGVGQVFDPEKIILVNDHFAPAKDIKSAEQCKLVREFARAQGITHFYGVGTMGIEHALLPEQGLALPGDVVVGADSHTCTYGALGAFATGMGSTDIAVAMATGQIWMRVPETVRFVYHGQLPKWVGGKDLILFTIGQIGVDGALYKAMEFTGEVAQSLSMDGRLTTSNMAIEAGAKTGFFPVDETTLAYVEERAKRPYAIYRGDPDAEVSYIYEWDVSDLEPQVAFPHLPSNTRPISEARGIGVDQVVIGSCTNGRLEDLSLAADVLRGRRVAPDMRCIIIPATQDIYLRAVREGLVEAFIEAGAVVSTPTCGPCLGGHMGVLAAGERCVSTTNRNFVGRMGHPESEVYLAGPAVAAASAVLGRIGGPEEL
ncbi:MAG: 3-isopropylmalate dehydratase large subunit [Chloroflexota bacterium]|nr:3-isopropylmalate dehydratase large subunit [Chloroflexota bacterium]